MIYLMFGAVALVAASIGWLLGGLNVSRRDEKMMDKYRRDYASIATRNGELAEENATLAQHLAEADAQLQLSVQEIHGLREEREKLQQQFAERVYEVKAPRKRTRAGQSVTTEVVE